MPRISIILGKSSNEKSIFEKSLEYQHFTDYELIITGISYAEKNIGLKRATGKSKIRFELRRKGLPDSLISQQEEEYDTEDFIDEIIRLVNKKYADKLDFSDYKSVQRVTAALARRGFGYEDIKLALSRIKNGDYDED